MCQNFVFKEPVSIKISANVILIYFVIFIILDIHITSCVVYGHQMINFKIQFVIKLLVTQQCFSLPILVFFIYKFIYVLKTFTNNNLQLSSISKGLLLLHNVRRVYYGNT